VQGGGGQETGIPRERARKRRTSLVASDVFPALRDLSGRLRSRQAGWYRAKPIRLFVPIVSYSLEHDRTKGYFFSRKQ